MGCSKVCCGPSGRDLIGLTAHKRSSISADAINPSVLTSGMFAFLGWQGQ